jgi:adenosylcobinamide hydrolase
VGSAAAPGRCGRGRCALTPLEPVLVELSVGDALRVLVWRFDVPMRAVSSASVGAGVGLVEWVCNIQVPLDFNRVDLDDLVGEVASELGVNGPGVGLLTATGVERWERASESGVTVDATVGVSKPTWAAAADGGFTPWRPGTINVVAHLPWAMTDAAMVGAVITITEAKAQALLAAGVPGTGTASDAVVVVAPSATGDDASRGDVDRFAGPRSVVGAPLARVVCEVVGRRAGSDPQDGVASDEADLR